ncbi:chloride channel protein [Williamwhitmania taraxaci]|uniref:Chloride channel protein, CIC family n=1 Tax=Williamwhitmania taraxaci TaxID=1640674 RepID=A0A1G6K4H3_9BACT|nr:chloride channel protein [Williamwhitmania taraxaci]SDC25864.1 chloride channel protein, CIC family [Williamwhitmania taraxaci]
MKYTFNTKSFLFRLLFWLRAMPPKRLIIILSFAVGIMSGLAAVVLKQLIHFVKFFLTSWFPVESESYLYLAYPMLGIFLTVLFVRYYVKDNISHGITRVLYAISRRESRLKRHNTYSSMIASSLTIGFGGSVGAEAPIVLTGASLGSQVGQWLGLDYKRITLLLGCGAAGAVAGIFKAPVAGILFTLEILMLDLTMASIVPLLISAVTATFVSNFLMGSQVPFAENLLEPFRMSNVPFYLILGLFCGLISYYFTETTLRIEQRLSRIDVWWKKLLIGGISLGLLIFLFPPLYGEGYETLEAFFNGHASDVFANTYFYAYRGSVIVTIIFLSLVLFLKVLAMAFTNGAGGVGGIFAPSLFMGGVAGYLVATIINATGWIQVSPVNFAMVGMAGIMSGVMHAPLTAIFLIAEITGGYTLFPPLAITATAAYLTIIYFEPHSLYTKRLAQSGDLITHHKDKALLTLLKLDSVIERDFTTVTPTDTLGQLVKSVSRSRRNLFPVVDDKGIFLGIVLLDDIRTVMFRSDSYETSYVKDFMSFAPASVSLLEPMESVLKKFEDSGAWNLPVVEDGLYVGFVSKSKILSAYREMLVQFSDD